MPGDLSLTDPHTVPTRFWHQLDDRPQRETPTCKVGGTRRQGHGGGESPAGRCACVSQANKVSRTRSRSG